LTLPPILGPVGARFFLQEEYALGYIAFSVSSNEEISLGPLLHDLVHGRGEARRLLDIGSADGRLTKQVGRDCDHITFFEPNPVLYSLSLSRLRPVVTTLDAWNTIFPDGNSDAAKHDAAIVSHVLYHVQREAWPIFFASLACKVRPGGLLLVVLWNDNSEARRLSVAIDPSRWLICASDLEEAMELIAAAGFALIRRIVLRPRVRTFSAEVAGLVTAFLAGQRNSIDSHRSDNARALCSKMLDEGISNQQTVFVLERMA
jgi:hypothetical protein